MSKILFLINEIGMLSTHFKLKLLETICSLLYIFAACRAFVWKFIKITSPINWFLKYDFVLSASLVDSLCVKIQCMIIKSNFLIGGIWIDVLFVYLCLMWNLQIIEGFETISEFSIIQDASNS